MRAVAGEGGHALGTSGQIEKVTCCIQRHLADADLEAHIRVLADHLAEILGTRRQNWQRRPGFTVARVSAATGPSPQGASCGCERRDARPFAARADRGPEHGPGFDSLARYGRACRFGAAPVPSPCRARWRASHRPPVLGIGVKPSPTPDPQSFQNCRSGMRRIIGRANPIIENAQSAGADRAKRKKLKLTVCMAVPLGKVSGLSDTFARKRKDL
jgi:hypothetical protein